MGWKMTSFLLGSLFAYVQGGYLTVSLREGNFWGWESLLFFHFVEIGTSMKSISLPCMDMFFDSSRFLCRKVVDGDDGTKPCWVNSGGRNSWTSCDMIWIFLANIGTVFPGDTL